jgi:hypothetical protein
MPEQRNKIVGFLRTRAKRATRYVEHKSDVIARPAQDLSLTRQHALRMTKLFGFQDRFTEAVPHATLLLQTDGDFIH